MPANLTFFGGVDEIGGNKILVKDKDTSVLLDFGKSFGTWGRYFEEYMKPTSSRGIETFWKTGLLPDLKGIYRPDLLEFAGAPVHKELAVDAILLSHAHQDHASYISFLDNEIPVYCSETTKTVLEAVEEVGQRDLEQEVTGFKLRPMLRKDYRQAETPRNMKTVKGKVKIGSIEAEFHPVDHSIPGACAMVLHCSDSTIVYSGDIRLHGTFGHLTAEFAEAAALEKPDVFLCEGTRINSTSNHSEPYVKANASKVIQDTKDLVMVDYSWKDTTRFLTVFGIAKATGRKLVIPLRTAFYLEALKSVIPALPDTKDDSILLYMERAGSGTYAEEDYTGAWRKAFLSYPNLVKADYIHKHQGQLIACLGYFDMVDLVDIKPAPGSAYIHSMSEPYNEEMEFDAERCQNWVNLFQLQQHQIHASGHAPKQDLFQVASTVKAKSLIPIHTEHPELFKETGQKLTLATVGKEVIL